MRLLRARAKADAAAAQPFITPGGPRSPIAPSIPSPHTPGLGSVQGSRHEGSGSGGGGRKLTGGLRGDLGVGRQKGMDRRSGEHEGGQLGMANALDILGVAPDPSHKHLQ